jgi:hypothetical protein
MRTPFAQFCKQESISKRLAYNEVTAGRLVLTKVGRKSFVDDADAAAWRALAPKVTGNIGQMALKLAAQSLQRLGQAVSEGTIDRATVIDEITKVVRQSGLVAEHIT